jgi:hypothetical protein
MPKSSLLVLAAFCVMLMSVGTAHAQGLVGERYVLVEGGTLSPGGDPPFYLDEWHTYNPIAGVDINVPLRNFIDFFANYSYQKVSWDYIDKTGMPLFPPYTITYFAEANLFSGGFRYHRSVSEPIDVFAHAWGGAVRTSVVGHQDTDFWWGAGGGAEIALGDKLSLSPSAEFNMIVADGENENDGTGELSVNYWILENVFLDASSFITFDDKDIGILGGAGLRF